MRLGWTRTLSTRRVNSRFTFRLEPLLQLHKAREAELAAALARAQRDLESSEAHARELEAELASVVCDLANSGMLLAVELERSAAAARTSVASRREAVHEARAALADGMRERKAIELLKDRRLAEFLAEEARKEERELDEANHR